MASGPVTTAPGRDVHRVVAGYCKYFSLQFSIVIMVLDFCMEFSWILCCRQCSHYLVPFQKWPQVDISPVESLLVVFAYEKCTKETVSMEEICNGSLGPKLTQEDFDTALQVL